MSDEVKGAVRVAPSRNLRQTDVALAPACGRRPCDLIALKTEDFGGPKIGDERRN